LLEWNGVPNGSFAMPRAIATDASGSVYVGDGSPRVVVCNGTGGFIRQWGNIGTADGEFQGVTSIAIGPDGTVYVLDAGIERVQAFTPDGAFITKWGTSGSGEGQFSSPQGIAVGANGTVYVADTENDRIQEFTPQGVFVRQWGVSGTAPGQLDSPIDIAIIGEKFYVTDFFSRVQEFAEPSVPVLGTSWGKLKASYRD